MSTKYNEIDAQEDTGATEEEVEDTWHWAREDAQEEGELPEREENKQEQEEEE